MYITKLRKYLGLDTIEEQVSEYISVSEKLAEQKTNLDKLVDEHYEVTSEYNNGLKLSKENIIKSISGAELIHGKIEERYKNYFDNYCSQISSIKHVIDKLNSKKLKLFKDNVELQKAIESIEAENKINILKKAFKKGEISKGLYEITLNKLSKEGKTKYADAIVLDKEDRILFLKRNSNSYFEPSVYCLPGGHVDFKEDYKTAAIRELKEETNLDTVECEEVAKYEDDKVQIKYFECKIEENQNPFQQPYEIMLHANEHENYCWLSKEEWLKTPLICNLKDVLIELYGEEEIIQKSEDIDNKNALQTIIKAYQNNQISKEFFLDVIEKAHKYIKKETLSNGKTKYIYKEVFDLLNKIENELMYLSYERGVCFDKKYNKIFDITQKSKNSVVIDEKYKKFLEESIYTHNHPNSNGFSLEDINLCLSNKMKSCRVVVRNSIRGKGVYVMENNLNEKIDLNQHLEEINEKYSEWFDKNSNKDFNSLKEGWIDIFKELSIFKKDKISLMFIGDNNKKIKL